MGNTRATDDQNGRLGWVAAAVIVGNVPEGPRHRPHQPGEHGDEHGDEDGDEHGHGCAVLLVRRRVPEGKLVWQFPAGVIEAGESAEEAAVREAAEETGLVVRAVRVLGSRVHPVTHRVIVYVACEPVTGRARVASVREVEAIAWATRDQLPRYLPPTALFAPVQAYVDHALTP